MVSALVQKEAERVSLDLAVIAEPHRLLVLRQLRRGPHTAGSLARALGIAPSLASHHLSVLERAGLVTRRKVGHFVCYAADRARIKSLHDKLGRLAGASGAAAEAADRHPVAPC